MSQKIKVEFTKAQFLALCSLIDTVEASFGCSDNEGNSGGDFDTEARKEIKIIDRAINNAGYSR